MGIFDRRRQLAATDVAQIVAETVKALTPGLGQFPAGTTTTDVTGRVEAMAAAGMSTQMFGPGTPIQPIGLDPREPASQSAAPRRSQYPVGINLDMNGRRYVPFTVLRDTADEVDLVRRCIEVRKAHIGSIDWDITLSRRAVKRVMAEEGITQVGRASQLARERFEPDMARLRDWWENPDRQNGLDFGAWISMLLEEQLVVDAVSIWPRRNLAGDVIGLELIDGTTIKPLLDDRGATPIAPAPAYQQILYGFPRGEWVASTDGVVDEFSRNQLVYRPRHRRTWSPYGFSEVEQVLSSADMYLKRIGWIRSEFDDGVTPDLWIKTDVAVGTGAGQMSPDMLLQYESVMNQSLAGQTKDRHALHLLPRGFEPAEMEQFAEKYNPDLDEFLIKLICMCFSVMPTEVGFPPKSGIGGKGHQEGEENSAFRKDIRPSVKWLASLLTQLSREFLGMPPELEFSFIGYESEDQLEAEQVSDLRVKGARSTINEERGRKGLPLFEFPEADIPFVQTSAGLVFLPGSLAAAGQTSDVPTAGPDAEEAPTADTGPDPVEVADGEEPEAGDEIAVDLTGDGVPDGYVTVSTYVRRKPQAVADEAKAFVKFVAKRAGTSKAWRPFTFEAMPARDAAVLNELGRTGDIEAVRRLVGSITRG